jgi:hypothetical protein
MLSVLPGRRYLNLNITFPKAYRARMPVRRLLFRLTWTTPHAAAEESGDDTPLFVAH